MRRLHLPRHFSYANVVATLALVFAMSGGALAANSYLIDSTKDIKPNVLKKLRGRTGKTGTTGKGGASGATGATGAPGKEGPAGKDGVGTPLFFKAKANTGPTVIASLDGAQIIAECSATTRTIVKLHATANGGVYHGWYSEGTTGIEDYEDELKAGQDLSMQGKAGLNDDEGWFAYIGPNGVITSGIFGDDAGGSPSKDCLVWGNLNTSSTGSTGGAS